MTNAGEIADNLTPDSLERLILDMAHANGATGSVTLAVGVIAERLLSGCEFSSATERSHAQTRLENEIARQVAHIAGVRLFVNE